MTLHQAFVCSLDPSLVDRMRQSKPEPQSTRFQVSSLLRRTSLGFHSFTAFEQLTGHTPCRVERLEASIQPTSFQLYDTEASILQSAQPTTRSPLSLGSVQQLNLLHSKPALLMHTSLTLPFQVHLSSHFGL